MRAFAFIILVFFSLGALAPVASGAPTPDCADASDQATLNECASQDYAKSDAELNRVYKEIRRRLSDQPDVVKKLVVAQKAWIVFRDAECEFSGAGVQDGSAYPMLVSICRNRLSQSRVKDLKAYLSCEEGDLGCSVPLSN